jgi:hypothetical protein
MGTIAARLDDILATRKARAKELGRSEAEWIGLRETLLDLTAALDELSRHPKGPEGAAELASRIGDLQGEIHRDVGGRLGRVARRFSRGTLNIGVGGRARVGKSTLLQNLSGLDEDQIPTGEADAVTAVRSRIFHSTTRQHAEIEFHTWESFREALVAPYFQQLGLGSPPNTLEGFKRYKMPDAPGSTEYEDAELRRAKWDRLRQMQWSLPSYADLLTGGRRTFDLEGLRKYVAYPTEEEAKREQDEGVPADRCYLAVKDAAIYCRFPEADVFKVGIIDLPGTGEIVAANENRHLAELEDEVDFVLQVSRPARYSIWEIQDAKTLELIKQSRCGAVPEDFCWLLVNTGGATEKQLSAYEVQLKGKTSGYRTQRFDAIDRQSVRDDVLSPALAHLAERLPSMDEAAMAYALRGTETTAERVRSALAEVGSVLDSLGTLQKPGARIFRLATELHRRLGARFYKLEQDLADRARTGDTSEFEAAVQGCADECETFLEGGLGLGRERWISEITDELQTSKSTGGIATRQLDWVRINFSRRFSGLDSLLDARIDELHRRVAQILTERLHLQGDDAVTQLQHFRELAQESGTRHFEAAVDELLDLRISYRSHFHPQVRRAMVLLEPEEPDERDSNRKTRISPVSFDEDGAEELLDQLENLGSMVVGECTRELYERAHLADQVIYAAAEQFADGLLRAGSSDEQFHNFAVEHRDRIWPDEFESLNVEHGIRKKCRRALEAALAAATSVSEANR